MVKMSEIIKEHDVSSYDKNAQAYYYKTIKSLIDVTNDLFNNYGKTDNINQLDKAMSKLDDIINEATKFKRLIKNVADEHYKQK